MQINLDKVGWKTWATEEELSGLLGIRSMQLRCIRERKRIRDRCYQRARRNAMKEGAGDDG